jgi:hypothetical protein
MTYEFRAGYISLISNIARDLLYTLVITILFSIDSMNLPICYSPFPIGISCRVPKPSRSLHFRVDHCDCHFFQPLTQTQGQSRHALIHGSLEGPGAGVGVGLLQ